MLQQPAYLAILGQASPRRPPSPHPSRLSKGVWGPGACLVLTPWLALPPGHCHFSSRHQARPHLHYSPDGSPQPRFPELPAALVSVPEHRKGHGPQAQRPLQGEQSLLPSQPRTQQGWFGLGSGVIAGWKPTPLLLYSQLRTWNRWRFQLEPGKKPLSSQMPPQPPLYSPGSPSRVWAGDWGPPLPTLPRAGGLSSGPAQVPEGEGISAGRVGKWVGGWVSGWVGG